MADLAMAQAGPLAEGRAAAEELADALKAIGITLPSLRGDWPALNGGGLVQIGGAPPQTVRALATWIREHAEPLPDQTPRPPEAKRGAE